jgi:hypothetical protein
MMPSAKQAVARERLIVMVLRHLSSERSEQDDAHYGDELDYCNDLILDAARELVRAAEEEGD